MRLPYSRFEEIKGHITNLLIDYDINNLPIDVFLLAKKMNIKIIKYSEFKNDEKNKIISSSNDGMSFYSDTKKRYYIVYNDNMDNKRIRFTIAHEIGHITLGHEEANEETEYEANFFARNLLVPMSLVIDNKITDCVTIKLMFEVSNEVANRVIKSTIVRLDRGHEKFEEYEIELLKHFK